MPASHSLFLAASNWLPSSPSAASLPTSSKLRLYGLFKVLTSPPDAQPGPQTARPGFWSVEGRSKWDAWDAAAKEVAAKDDGEQGKAEARAEYVEIARSVGFDMTEEDVLRQPAAEDDVDLDHLSSDDERDREAERAFRPRTDNSEGKSGGVGGKTISRLNAAEEEDGASPLPFSLLSYPTALRSHLQSHPSELNIYSPEGLTLLHLASDQNLPQTVALLLELGGDRSLKDVPDDFEEEGMTALEMAEGNGAGWEEVIRLLST